MSITAEGREGELWAREWLMKRGVAVFQPDWIGFSDNDYFLVEVKHQERFEAPPFDGHGLPKWQVDARLEFFQKTGIRTALLVHDKGTGDVFIQWLDELEAGEKFQTNGAQPRRVYPLTAFENP